MHGTSPLRSPPEGRVASIAAQQLGLVTRRQAAQAGCSDKMLRRLCRVGQLCRVRRGVYRFCAVPVVPEQRLLAGCLGTSGSLACSVSAMRLYGFEARSARSEAKVVHVVSTTIRHDPCDGGVRVHRTRRLDARDRRIVRGVPVVAPLRMLEEVASLLSSRDLDGLVGHLLACRLVSGRELAVLASRIAHRPSGRKGCRRLRTCLERAALDLPAESLLERQVLQLLLLAGCPLPEGQVPLYDPDGGFVARPDFVWRDSQVILEVDGYRWHAAPAAFRLDRRRQNRLQALGWTVFRVTAADVQAGLDELIPILRARLRGRWRGLEVPVGRGA